MFQEQQINATALVLQYCADAVQKNRRLAYSAIALLFIFVAWVIVAYWPLLQELNRKI